MKHTQTFEHCYKLLRLEQNSSWDDLRKSYRQLIRQWHPDRYPDEQEKAVADSKLKDINTAYTQLSNYYQKTGVLPFAKTHSPKAEKATTNPQPKNQAQAQAKTQVNPEKAVNRGSHKTKPEHSRFSQTRSSNTRRSKTRIPAYVFTMLFLGLLSLVFFDFNSIEHFIDTYLDNAEQYNEFKPHKYNNQVNATVQTTPGQPGFAKTEAGEKNTEDRTKTASSNQFAVKTDPQAGAKFFTYGSTLADVALIQGPPDRMEGNTWFYGESEVHFVDGVVDYWYRTADKPLKASAIVQDTEK